MLITTMTNSSSQHSDIKLIMKMKNERGPSKCGSILVLNKAGLTLHRFELVTLRDCSLKR